MLHLQDGCGGRRASPILAAVCHILLVPSYGLCVCGGRVGVERSLLLPVDGSLGVRQTVGLPFLSASSLFFFSGKGLSRSVPLRDETRNPH